MMFKKVLSILIAFTLITQSISPLLIIANDFDENESSENIAEEQFEEVVEILENEEEIETTEEVSVLSEDEEFAIEAFSSFPVSTISIDLNNPSSNLVTTSTAGLFEATVGSTDEFNDEFELLAALYADGDNDGILDVVSSEASFGPGNFSGGQVDISKTCQVAFNCAKFGVGFGENLPDGAYVAIAIIANVNTGEVLTDTLSYAGFNIDNTAPTVNQLVGTTFFEGDAIPAFEVTGEDNFGFGSLCFEINGPEAAPYNCILTGTGTDYTWTLNDLFAGGINVFDTSAFPEGTYEINYRVVDLAGNMSELYTVVYELENVAPQVTINASSQYVFPGESINFSGSFTDPSSVDFADGIHDDAPWFGYFDFGNGDAFDFGPIATPGAFSIPAYEFYNLDLSPYTVTTYVCEAMPASVPSSEGECGSASLEIHLLNPDDFNPMSTISIDLKNPLSNVVATSASNGGTFEATVGSTGPFTNDYELQVALYGDVDSDGTLDQITASHSFGAGNFLGGTTDISKTCELVFTCVKMGLSVGDLLPDGDYVAIAIIRNISTSAVWTDTLSYAGFALDNTNPTANVLSDADFLEGESIPDFEIIGQDNSGLESICFSITGPINFLSLPMGCHLDGNGTEFTWLLNSIFAGGIDVFDTSVFVEGNYVVEYYVRDLAGNVSDTVVANYTVSNVAPSVVLMNNQTILEGEQAIFSASFTDPSSVDFNDGIFDDAPWTASVNYGDGTVVSLGSFSTPGIITIPNHLYTGTGIFTVTLTLCEADPEVTASSEGECGTATVVVTVLDQETPDDGGDDNTDNGSDNGNDNGGNNNQPNNNNNQNNTNNLGNVFFQSNGNVAGIIEETTNGETGSGSILGLEDQVCEIRSLTSGYVFRDENGNNVRDENESGFANISLVIFLERTNDDGTTEEVVVRIVRTNEQGLWETDLCPGDYSIRISNADINEGFRLVGGNTLGFSVAEGQDTEDVNFVVVEVEGETEEAGFNWWILLLILALIILIGSGYYYYRRNNQE